MITRHLNGRTHGPSFGAEIAPFFISYLFCNRDIEQLVYKLIPIQLVLLLRHQDIIIRKCLFFYWFLFQIVPTTCVFYLRAISFAHILDNHGQSFLNTGLFPICVHKLSIPILLFRWKLMKSQKYF